MIFIKRPSRGFKFNKEQLKEYRSKRKKREKNFLKQQNLNLSTMNENTILNLQNRIGNKQTLVLLKELGDLGILNNDEVLKAMFDEGNIVQFFGNNEYKETQREIENFKKLSRMNNQKSADAVKSKRFSVNHNKVNKPDMNKEDIPKYCRGLMSMVIYFRGYDPRKDEAQKKVEVDEKIVDPLDKKLQDEVDTLMKMIGRLPDMNEREPNIEAYMKVLNFLVSSGCDLNLLFANNGNINRQKEIIFEAIKKEKR